MKRFRWMGVVLTIIGVATMIAPVSASPKYQTFSASLTPIGGVVQYLPTGKSDWVTVNQVTLVNQGDQIRTGDNGTAKLNVVTGSQVDLGASTVVELNTLANNKDNSGMTFSVTQLLGTTTTTVSQTIKNTDSLHVNTPTFTANIRGTRFTTFITPSGSTAIIGNEGSLQILGADGSSIKMGPHGLVVTTLDSTGAPVTADINFLSSHVKIQGVDDASKPGSIGNPAVQTALKGFFKDFLKGSHDPAFMGFVAGMLGLPANASIDDLNKALDGNTPLTIGNLQAGFNTFITTSQNALAGNPLAPTSCGNGVQDAGETKANCPLDFADLSTCGDATCDLSKGESAITCAADCNPLGTLLEAAAQLNTKKNENVGAGNNPGNGGASGIGGTGGSGAGPTVGTNQTSGNPNDPGPIVNIAVLGDQICKVTTTTNVNLLSTVDDTVVLAVVPVGTSLTTKNTNGAGYVVTYNELTGSIATSLVSKSAGCPS